MTRNDEKIMFVPDVDCLPMLVPVASHDQNSCCTFLDCVDLMDTMVSLGMLSVPYEPSASGVI